jgi:hypothetical protein
MQKITVLLIASLLATALATPGASARAHRRHPPAHPQKTQSTEPAKKPITRLPVSPDTFRA